MDVVVLLPAVPVQVPRSSSLCGGPGRGACSGTGVLRGQPREGLGEGGGEAWPAAGGAAAGVLGVRRAVAGRSAGGVLAAVSGRPLSPAAPQGVCGEGAAEDGAAEGGSMTGAVAPSGRSVGAWTAVELVHRHAPVDAADRQAPPVGSQPHDLLVLRLRHDWREFAGALLTLPFAERVVPVRAFPLRKALVLVVDPNAGKESGRDAPLDRSPDQCGVAPAVRVAGADGVTRVVDALEQGPAHTRRVARLPRLSNSPHPEKRCEGVS